MIKYALLATILVISSLGSVQAASKPAFHCGGLSLPFKSQAFKTFASKHAKTIHMRRLIERYTQLWEQQEIAKRCEQAGSGQPVDTSCLYGKQDFQTIKASIPTSYFKMNDGALHEQMLKFDKDRILQRQIIATRNACIKAGLWRGKIKKVE